MTDRRTDGQTDGRMDGGDCNIPDAFLKKRGDNNYRILNYNNYLLKKKRINFISFFFFFDRPPLWCFGLMSTVSIFDIFVK